jgi:hypothetical protein
LPAQSGKLNSVWKRFDRLSKTGTFDLFFEHLASLSSWPIWCRCSTQRLLVPMSRRGKKG